MTGVAGHDGLATPVEHDARPVRRLPFGVGEVGQGPDVMDLDVASGAADLAGVRQQAGDQFLLRIVHADRFAVGHLDQVPTLNGKLSPHLQTEPAEIGAEHSIDQVVCADAGERAGEAQPVAGVV